MVLYKAVICRFIRLEVICVFHTSHLTEHNFRSLLFTPLSPPPFRPLEVLAPSLLQLHNSSPSCCLRLGSLLPLFCIIGTRHISSQLWLSGVINQSALLSPLLLDVSNCPSSGSFPINCILLKVQIKQISQIISDMKALFGSYCEGWIKKGVTSKSLKALGVIKRQWGLAGGGGRQGAGWGGGEGRGRRVISKGVSPLCGLGKHWRSLGLLILYFQEESCNDYLSLLFWTLEEIYSFRLKRSTPKSCCYYNLD